MGKVIDKIKGLLRRAPEVPMKPLVCTPPKPQGKQIGYKPKEGYVWNPLLKLPRNAPCPCGSLMKFKFCHLKNMPRVLNPHHIPKPK